MGLKAVATLVPGGGAPVGGSGTPGTLAKFTGAGTSIGDSAISESGILISINAGVGTNMVINDGTGMAGPSYDGVRLCRGSEALFSSSDSVRTFRAGVTGATVVAGSTTSHDLLLQRGNVTALTLGASGAVAFAGNLTSSAAQTWTLAAGTSALNIASNLLNLDTTNSRVGIGTASPTGRLHVVGGTAAAATNGAPVTIIAQNAGTGNQNGGNIVLTPGALSGIGSAGVADLSGPTGTGLKLPATPGNADTQTLDCYAEGTWTPTLSGGATWGGTAPTANFANYTRVGRLIFFEIELIPTAATAFSATWGLSSFTLPVSAPRSTAIACNRNAASANAVTSSANLLLPTFGLSAENLRISGVYAV
jgi:hypothetical protein